MPSDITFTKGSFSITVQTIEVNDNYSNKLFFITPGQSKNNQSNGPQEVKVIDLQRITREFVIRGGITSTDSKTAKQVKDDLASIFEGGGINGGVTTMVYEGDSIEGYIEKLTFTDKASDEPTSTPTDYLKYLVSITFVRGNQIG